MIFRRHFDKLTSMLGIIIRRDFPRPMISHIKRNLLSNQSRGCKEGLVGIEIGVLEGKNALSILKTLPIRKLYLIDPYLPYEGYPQNMEGIFIKAMKKLSKYKSKIVFIKKKSKDAKIGIKGQVDFVYIDGSHSYKDAKQDIQLYKDLVKNGGYIGGHDIESSPNNGVLKAVLEEFEPKDVSIFTPDWWVKVK